MDKVVNLDLETPVAAIGKAGQVWFADGASNSVVRYDAQTGSRLENLELDVTPVDLAIVSDAIAIASQNGLVLWHSINTGREIYRVSISSANLALKADNKVLWVLDREHSKLVAFDYTNKIREIKTGSVKDFAVGRGKVYWLSYEGAITCHDSNAGVQDETKALTTDQTGSISYCANSLWISVTDGLMMASVLSLEAGNILPAPEGPVPHLICNDGAIIGGKQGLFVLDPSTDNNIYPVDISLRSELCALVGADNCIWALESDEPLVHIFHVH